MRQQAVALGKRCRSHDDLLFDNQPHLELNQLGGYTDRLQLNLSRYTAEMDEHLYLQRVREHMQSGRESGVRHTPTFFLNGKIQDVSFGLQSLYAAIAAAPRK